MDRDLVGGFVEFLRHRERWFSGKFDFFPRFAFEFLFDFFDGRVRDVPVCAVDLYARACSDRGFGGQVGLAVEEELVDVPRHAVEG